MENSQDKTQRIAKNSLMLFLRMIIVLIIGLYTSRVVLASLGVEDFGIYNLVGSIVVLFTFLQQALTNATFRFMAYEQGRNDIESLRNTFSMALNAHIILALLLFVVSEIFGLWFLNNKLVIEEGRMTAANWAFQFSVFSFLISIVQTPYNSAVLAHEKMGFYAYTSVASAILKLITAYLITICVFDRLVFYSFLQFAIIATIFICYYLLCRTVFSECKYKRVWKKDILRRMINYSGWSIIVNACDVTITQSIVFMFNMFGGVVANAALGIANQVSGQLGSFHSSFTQSFNPQIIKSYASNDYDYFYKLIFSSSKMSFYLLLFVAVPVIINIDYILKLWLVTPPEGSSVFVILMIVYSLVDAYSAPLWIGVHATGNLKTHQILMASIKIFNIPLAYILLKLSMPLYTALLIKVVLNIVCSIVRPCYVKKLYKLPLRKYFKEVFFVVYLIAILTVPVTVFISSCIDAPFKKLFVSGFIHVFLFIPAMLYMGLTKNERMLCFKMIKNIKTRLLTFI